MTQVKSELKLQKDQALKLSSGKPGSDKECKQMDEEQCHPVTKQVCKKVHYTVRCRDVATKKCGHVHRQVCKVHYTVRCRDVTTKEYRHVPMEHCSDLVDSLEQLNRETIQHKQCWKVDKRLCHRVPLEQCMDVSTRRCSTSYEKKCHPATTEEGKTVLYREQCRSITKDVVHKLCKTRHNWKCEQGE